jgi:DNA repair protein RecO (recombination protein O)
VAKPAKVFRTKAIVLRRQNLGEADRILTLYTHDHGKLKVVAKGVRKPQSRKAGHVELFAQVDVLIARGRSSLDVLSQADLIDAYQPIREDLIHTTYAAHFVELLDAFTEEADESPPLYQLLVDGLSWLGQTTDLRRTARYYELHLLGLAGYRPELFRCVVCGEPIQARDQFYSAADGGVICPSCGHAHPRGKPISLDVLKVLRYMQTRPFEVVEQLTLRPAVLAETERILHGTLTYHLERRLKSVSFLRRLRREESQRGSS